MIHEFPLWCSHQLGTQIDNYSFSFNALKRRWYLGRILPLHWAMMWPTDLVRCINAFVEFHILYSFPQNSYNWSFLEKVIVSTFLLLILGYNVICINYYGKMKVYTWIYILYYWTTKPTPPARDIPSLLPKYFAPPFRQLIEICLPWDYFIASYFNTGQARKSKEMPR